MNDRRRVASQLLAIVKDIHDGGREIVGDRWALFRKMTTLAEHEDVAGMAGYFEECLKSTRGQRVAEKLRANGKKTLETEAGVFRRVVADCIEESKLAYQRSAEHARAQAVDPLDELLRTRHIADKVDESLKSRCQRFQREGGNRLRILPSLTLRHTPPELENAGRYLKDAALCYVLTLYDGAAVLSRAALELILQERLRLKDARLKRGTERLQLLIDGARSILTPEQMRDVARIKEVGDRAAHGEHADDASARDALLRLRRLVRALYA